MKSFGQQVLSFYEQLGQLPAVPEGVEILQPYLDADAWKVMQTFYQRFYDDTGPRVFLIGINPGRFGAGVTGVPFTDPIRLQEVCGIDHIFARKAELSSKFIYALIAQMNGAKDFYKRYYFTSVSPVGFTKSGKNLNYYDLRALQDSWEPFMIESLTSQIAFGPVATTAYSLGQGKNYKYLQYLNQKYQLFETIKPLPHPRWVMQYRLKRLQEFIELFQKELLAIKL